MIEKEESKLVKTLKSRYGEDYFRNMGRKGGLAKVPKGFAANPELARIAGCRGGRISKRKVSNGRDNQQDNQLGEREGD